MHARVGYFKYAYIFCIEVFVLQNYIIVRKQSSWHVRFVFLLASAYNAIKALRSKAEEKSSR